MNKLLAKLIIFTLILICFKTVAFNKVVSVVSLVDYPPYVFVEGNQPVIGTISTQSSTERVEGYSWDVLKESFLTMGYSIEYEIVPWPRALKLLVHGQTDLLFPISKSDKRLRSFNYSKESINTVNYVIYFPKNSSIKWEGYKSLNETTIGIKRGYHYGEKWHAFKNVAKYEIGNISDGFQMLDNGHIDGFIGYENSWDYVLRQKGWELKFRKTPIVDSNLEYVVSMKGVEKNNKLLEVYDKGKRILIENGRLQEIKRRWFGLNKTKSTPKANE